MKDQATRLRPYVIAAAVVAATAFFAVALFATLVGTTDTAKEAETTSATNRNIILRFCEETNKRHDETIRRLDQLIEQIPPGPRRERAEQSRPGTVLLIQALAPKRNCERVVERAESSSR